MKRVALRKMVFPFACIGFLSSTAFAAGASTTDLNSAEAQFVKSYFSERGQGIKNSTALEHTKQHAAHGVAESYRPQILNNVFSSVGLSISSVTETANITNITTNPNGLITINAYVSDEISWDDNGTMQVSVISVPHTLEVKNTGNGGFVIVKDEFDEGMAGISSTKGSQDASYRAKHPVNVHDSNISGEATKTATTKKMINGQLVDVKNTSVSPEITSDLYNRSGAVSYAKQYTYSGATGGGVYPSYCNNQYYVNFNPDGGDCANFASQAMSKGGGVPLIGNPNNTTTRGGSSDSTKWYYLNNGTLNYIDPQLGYSTTSNTDDAWTSTWINANSHYNFQVGPYGYGYTGGTSSNVATGDLLYVNWSGGSTKDHVNVVTGFTSSLVPLITCHNNDYYNLPYTGDVSSSSSLTWVNVHRY